MRRTSIPVSVLAAVLLLGALAFAGLRPAVAQDATPAAEDFAPEGVTFVPLSFGSADQLPATPADFFLARAGFEPGAGFPIEADDPSVTLVSMESGVLTFRVEAPISVTRAATIAAFATPGVDENTVPGPEAIAAGTEFTMTTGDSAIFPANVPGEVRNDGAETAVALLAIIEPLSGGGAAASPAAGGSAVEIRDFAYDPDPIEVAAGTTLAWTNQDDVPHTATAEDGSFDTGRIDTGQDGSATFDQPGTYAYVCTFHPKMAGTVVVT